jgi:hypothetical protein
MSKTTAAGARGSLTRLFPITRRVETIGHTLPIWFARVPLVTVLFGDYSVKLERFACIEVPRILPQMLTQEFAPQWADDRRVPDRRIHLGVT